MSHSGQIFLILFNKVGCFLKALALDPECLVLDEGRDGGVGK